MDTIRDAHHFVELEAHGLAVGLKDGLMGNSEVGHLNIGAGRIVWQDIVKIDQSQSWNATRGVTRSTPPQGFEDTDDDCPPLLSLLRDTAIRKDEFKSTPNIVAAMNQAKENGGRLHLMGLVSVVFFNFFSVLELWRRRRRRRPGRWGDRQRNVDADCVSVGVSLGLGRWCPRSHPPPIRTPQSRQSPRDPSRLHSLFR